MRASFAGAILFCGALFALPAGDLDARADGLFVRGQIGDVFVGVDTRDRHFHGHDRKHFDRKGFDRRHHGRKPRHDPDAGPLWRDDRSGKHRRFDRDGFGSRQQLLFRSGPVNDFARDRKRERFEVERSRDRHFHPKPHHPHRHLHRPKILPFVGVRVEDDDDGREETGARAAVPAPQTRPAAAQPTPPDPRGPTVQVARGREAGLPAGIEVGRPLPAGRPHVALDWEDYDLPRPPRGQSYARFDGAVLRIDTGTRVVREILWPAG